MPYGREIYGSLTIDKSDGCSPFKINSAQADNELSHFVMIEAGNCNLKLKALNAESAGANFLIVSATSAISQKNLIDNSYDLATMNVDIPTIVVTPDVAAKLVAMTKKSGEVLLRFQMPIPQSNQVILNVNIVKNDNRIYGFLRSFRTYALHFEHHIDVNFSFFKDAEHPDEMAKIQIMANCMDFENVFDMLGSFNEFCVQKNNITPECMRSIAQSYDAKDFMKFEQCYKRKVGDIETVKSAMKTATPGTHSYLSINNMLYHGSVKPENVFEAICGAFTKSPEYCLFLNNKYTANLQYHSIREKSKRHKFWVLFANVVFSVIVLSLAGAAMVFIFRKIYQRVLNERIADMVRESVINYRSLKNNE